MELTTQDYLKKTLMDTQERVRDFMHFSEKMEGKELKQYFRTYAETEAMQARQLQDFLKEMNE